MYLRNFCVIVIVLNKLLNLLLFFFKKNLCVKKINCLFKKENDNVFYNVLCFGLFIYKFCMFLLIYLEFILFL